MQTISHTDEQTDRLGAIQFAKQKDGQTDPWTDSQSHTQNTTQIH